MLQNIIQLIDMRSFSSLWYWIALAVTWSTTSHWVLGVPFDMVTRARRRGGAEGEDLVTLTRINVARLMVIGREAGLALGGSLDNAILVGDDAIVNEGGLRFDDEFIRHKALDCVGDLFLAGARFEGKLVCARPGHGINNKLVRALLADADAWEFTTPRELATAVKSARVDASALAGPVQVAF